mmetsp:Transcript_27001/g.63250  ORF Transcript_27001/g.63250 Transcript_27001/m.63250 type:complete len:231 (+) Transcript_27001:1927-2619(+)
MVLFFSCTINCRRQPFVVEHGQVTILILILFFLVLLLFFVIGVTWRVPRATTTIATLVGAAARIAPSVTGAALVVPTSAKRCPGIGCECWCRRWSRCRRVVRFRTRDKTIQGKEKLVVGPVRAEVISMAIRIVHAIAQISIGERFICMVKTPGMPQLVTHSISHFIFIVSSHVEFVHSRRRGDNCVGKFVDEDLGLPFPTGFTWHADGVETIGRRNWMLVQPRLVLHHLP